MGGGLCDWEHDCGTCGRRAETGFIATERDGRDACGCGGDRHGVVVGCGGSVGV